MEITFQFVFQNLIEQTECITELEGSQFQAEGIEAGDATMHGNDRDIGILPGLRRGRRRAPQVGNPLVKSLECQAEEA
jgi:hypothetical protein